MKQIEIELACFTSEAQLYFNRQIKVKIDFCGINILRTTFTLIDPKSGKMTVKSSAILYFCDLCA